MFVLSVTRPPADGAAFGMSRVISDLPTTAAVAREATWILCGEPFRGQAGDSRRLASSLVCRDPGTQWVDTDTGLTFRVDSADNAPHPCPCCARLVLPTDHAYAYTEDAYCLGCFTWKRDTPQCLPANTAHSTEEPA